MFQCKICGKEFKRPNGHLTNKHNLNVFQYLKECFNYDIIEEYISGKSSKEIEKEIKEGNYSGIKSRKQSILTFLKENNVERRTSREGEKNYYKTHKIWNKGLTKADHPSIQKYAESRMGSNNPIFKASPEAYERAVHWQKYCDKEKLERHWKKTGEILRKKYKSGELVHWYKKISEENQRRIVENMHNGYIKWLQDNSQRKNWPGGISKPEKLVGLFLKENEIKFISQFTLFKEKNSWYKYDFLLPNYNLIIEFNGSYWHCDPKTYEENYYHQVKKCTAKQLWEYDKQKIEFAENKGFKVIVIWEEDIYRLTEMEIKGIFNEILQNKIYSKN